MENNDCCQDEDPLNVVIMCVYGFSGNTCTVLINKTLDETSFVTGTHHTDKVTTHTTPKVETTGTHHTTETASHTTKKK